RWPWPPHHGPVVPYSSPDGVVHAPPSRRCLFGRRPASGLTGAFVGAYARCPVLLALLYAVLRLLIDLLIIRGRPAADRDLELLVLRQELLVLRPTARRPPWRTADPMDLAALRRHPP